jgi:transketolase
MAELMIKEKIQIAESWAQKMRVKSIELTYKAGKNGGHIGGALSSVEIFASLYACVANVNLQNCCEESRDRVIVSKGHCVLSYFSALNLAGFLTDEQLDTFKTNGTTLYGHPSRSLERGIEFSAGSLGLGISFAVGVAKSCQLRNLNNRIFVILGDGECNEGIVWESLAFAAHHKLNNLTVILDRNRLQLDAPTAEICNMESFEDKFKAFNFDVEVVDGHKIEDLCESLMKHYDRPNVVIADTIKGKGVSFLENNPACHHCVLNEKQYKQAMEENGYGIE